MTKGELRRARKQARAEGKPLIGELAIAKLTHGQEFTETARGYNARERWAHHYDEECAVLQWTDRTWLLLSGVL